MTTFSLRRLAPLGRMRQVFWRSLLSLTGGLSVEGQLPEGPCIVVANHSSHADTAALYAALPGSFRPCAAAAADYWRSSLLRRLISQSVVSTLPVKREGGGYTALLEAAREHTQKGGIVVVFPEGTRSVTGEVGPFHSGAVRMSQDLGIPLVPTALVGTREMLPKHGSLSRSHVTVHFGHPVQDLSPEDLRSEVVSLLTA